MINKNVLCRYLILDFRRVTYAYIANTTILDSFTEYKVQDETSVVTYLKKYYRLVVCI